MARASGGESTIQGLTLDGGGTDVMGTDALVDHVAQTLGTLIPNSSGPTLYLYDVALRRSTDAVVHGRNASMLIFDCLISNFDTIGLWSEGCSECALEGTSVVGGPALGPYADFGILFEGSGAGTATRSGVAMTNGGLWRCRKNVIANADVGVEWNGISGGNYNDGTCEGAQTTTYKFTKSAGITGAGNRSNANEYARFTSAFNIKWQGFCTTTQKVYYDGLSRNCDVDAQPESFTAFVEIEHIFGALAWTGYRKARGSWISPDNNAPTDGWWERGWSVVPYTATSGNPFEWRCTLNGNPNGGTGVFASVGNMP